VSGLASASLASEPLVTLGGASARAVPVRVRVPRAQAKTGSNHIVFELTAQDDPALRVAEKAVFIVPK
jgi:hypothetical protein